MLSLIRKSARRHTSIHWDFVEAARKKDYVKVTFIGRQIVLKHMRSMRKRCRHVEGASDAEVLSIARKYVQKKFPLAAKADRDYLAMYAAAAFQWGVDRYETAKWIIDYIGKLVRFLQKEAIKQTHPDDSLMWEALRAVAKIPTKVILDNAVPHAPFNLKQHECYVCHLVEKNIVSLTTQLTHVTSCTDLSCSLCA